MDIDVIFEQIGDFGRYQRTNYLLICLPVMFAAGHSLTYVFTAGTPSYRCFVPECDDPERIELNPSWLPNAVPALQHDSGKFVPEPCERYLRNETYNLHINDTCSENKFIHSKREHCDSWIFDPEERTIVQDYLLTCQENAWKLAFVGTIHFAGLVVGNVFSGYLADRYGRKIIFILSTLFMAITGIAQGLSWDYESFLVFAFLNAVGTSGVYPLAFIIGVEMVGPRMRETSSVMLNCFYAVGEALVGLTAWALHDWQLIQFAMSVPALFCFAYFWLVPESVRWLLVRNEREKAKLIIQRAALVNKKKLSTSLLNSLNIEPEADVSKNDIFTSLKQIIQSRKLIIRYSIMLYIWAVNAVVFFGLSLNSTNLSGNKYFNFALVCLIEIPGYIIAWISLRKLGRRLALTVTLLVCGVTCIACGYVDEDNEGVLITLFLIGKCAVTASFAVIYTYTSEMMPTVIRSAGLGVMSTFARSGAMIAPFVPLLATYYTALPLLVFGATAFSGGILALFLPETFRQKLPDTFHETNIFTRANKNVRTSSSRLEYTVSNVESTGDIY